MPKRENNNSFFAPASVPCMRAPCGSSLPARHTHTDTHTHARTHKHTHTHTSQAHCDLGDSSPSVLLEPRCHSSRLAAPAPRIPCYTAGHTHIHTESPKAGSPLCMRCLSEHDNMRAQAAGVDCAAQCIETYLVVYMRVHLSPRQVITHSPHVRVAYIPAVKHRRRLEGDTWQVLRPQAHVVGCEARRDQGYDLGAASTCRVSARDHIQLPDHTHNLAGSLAALC